MSKTLDLLAELYNKIMNGNASDDEKLLYNSTIAISCIEEDILVEIIKQRAKELESN